MKIFVFVSSTKKNTVLEFVKRTDFYASNYLCCKDANVVWILVIVTWYYTAS